MACLPDRQRQTHRHANLRHKKKRPPQIGAVYLWQAQRSESGRKIFCQRLPSLLTEATTLWTCTGTRLEPHLFIAPPVRPGRRPRRLLYVSLSSRFHPRRRVAPIWWSTELHRRPEAAEVSTRSGFSMVSGSFYRSGGAIAVAPPRCGCWLELALAESITVQDETILTLMLNWWG